MINREDMLELTRRMTWKRTSFTRIAGAYIACDGEIDGTFNTSFLNLSRADKEKNLAIAKAIPFAATNKNLKRYRFSSSAQGPESMYRLLEGIKSCGLKNDALLEVFYEMAAAVYRTDKDYGILVFHDIYDIPRKGTDHERQGESEEVFEYIICAFCPLTGEYEPGKPEWGFLFPAFSQRSGAPDHVDVFSDDPQDPHEELLDLLGIL